MSLAMHDVASDFGENADGLFLHSEQVITDEFLTGLRDARDASLQPMRSEMHRAASVPVAVVERWLREGFNIYQAPARDILKRLQAEGLDSFITTRRRI